MIQIQLKFKSFDPYYIKLATNYIEYILTFLNIQNNQQIALPSKIQKFTVIRSPHIDKSSREQFQKNKYRKLIKINSMNQQQAVVFLELLKNSQLIGIELEINMKFLTSLEI